MARKSIAKYLNPWMWQREKKRERFEAVRARDGDNCWRCGHPMVFGHSGHKKAATMEHVNPRSKGGTNRLDNLRLCHVGCNRHLAANSPEQKERMRIGPARSTR
jgi:5-methylcytosine-specific restriction endonuclease McrA